MPASVSQNVGWIMLEKLMCAAGYTSVLAHQSGWVYRQWPFYGLSMNKNAESVFYHVYSTSDGCNQDREDREQAFDICRSCFNTIGARVQWMSSFRPERLTSH